MKTRRTVTLVVLTASLITTGVLAVGRSSIRADDKGGKTPVMPAVDGDMPDPWAGEFREYDRLSWDKPVFVPSSRAGAKVTISRKGDGYQLDRGGKIELRKVENRLEPIPERGFKWIELGEKDGDGFHTLAVVGSFKVEYLVRGKPPAAWTVVAGDGKRGRLSKPPAAVVSNWRACREYTLDGAGDHARVEDHPELRVSALTLSAWVNTSDAGRIQPVVAKSQAKGNWCSYMLRIQDGGRVSLVVENATGDQSAHWKTRAVLTTGKWHHVAATWACTQGDASDAKIYIDGVEMEVEMNRSVNYGKTFKIGYTAEPLYIGRDEMPSGHFLGTLRDVDVVCRVLTPAEIKSLAAKVPGGR